MDRIPPEVEVLIATKLPARDLLNYSRTAKGPNGLIQDEANHWMKCPSFLAYLARHHQWDPKQGFLLDRKWKNLDVKKGVSKTTHNSYRPKFAKRKNYSPSRFGTPHVTFGDCVAFGGYNKEGPLIAVETKRGQTLATIPLKEACANLCYYNDHLFWGPELQCWNISKGGNYETKSTRRISALAGGKILLVAVGDGLQLFPGGQEFHVSDRVSCLSVTDNLAVVGTYKGKIEVWDLQKLGKALHVFKVGDPIRSCQLTHHTSRSVLSAVVGLPCKARRLTMQFSPSKVKPLPFK